MLLTNVVIMVLDWTWFFLVVMLGVLRWRLKSSPRGSLLVYPLALIATALLLAFPLRLLGLW